MRTVTLQAFTDSGAGTLGLGVKGMPRNDDTDAAIDGLMIAHDLLEHVNGVQHIGTIDDELEALGAAWYTRGQFNDLRRDRYGSHYTVHENFATDIVRMFRDHVDGGAYVSMIVPRTQACAADVDFGDVLAIARDSYRAELADPSDAIATVWAQYRAVCLARFRIGYRKAQRKYKSATRANRLFWTVAEAVERYARNVKFEGAEYNLTFGWNSTGEPVARCMEAFEDDYYADAA